jgi:hypothetical protein
VARPVDPITRGEVVILVLAKAVGVGERLGEVRDCAGNQDTVQPLAGLDAIV